LKYKTMRKIIAVTLLESLASGVRLDVYRLLIRKGVEGMVAGDIAAALDLPPTNLSFHLKAMTQASLLTVEQEGRFQRYRANLALMQDLIAYLTEECCAGNPEQCPVPRRAKGRVSRTSPSAKTA
jgi:DNA-binding transcriptional ArsR family regulator